MWRKALGAVGGLALLGLYVWLYGSEPVWIHIAFGIWLALTAYLYWLRRQRKQHSDAPPTLREIAVGGLVLTGVYAFAYGSEPVWFHIAFGIWLALMAYLYWLRRQRKQHPDAPPTLWRATRSIILGLVLMVDSWALAFHIFTS